MNVWESVITRSRVNDGYYYDQERLPEFRWEWPTGTWFQARLDYVREHDPVRSQTLARKTRDNDELSAL